MEDWQREVIVNNMDKLVSTTKCNIVLLATLQASKILSEEEVDELKNPESNQSDRSHKLYSILQTRLNAYAALLKGLKSTKQSGALRILNDDTADFKVTIDEQTVLGKGSYGTVVYKGKLGDIDVAVKRIHIFDTDQLKCTRALHEISVLKSCDKHENIVRYFGSKKSDNYFLIFLEICVMTLRQWIKEKSINTSPMEVLRQTTVGLGWLHKQKIVHRDLKPDNILFTQDPIRIKISDFGLSRKIKDNRSSVSTSADGTKGWMASEILASLLHGKTHNCKFTFASDIFALGCTYYFVLTDGKDAFGDCVRNQANILDGKPVINEDDIVNGCKQNILFVKLMISKHPKSRPSCSSLLACPVFWTTDKHFVFIWKLNSLNIDTMGNYETIQTCSNCALHQGNGNELLRRTESDLNKISHCSNNAAYLLNTNLKTTLPYYFTSDGEFKIEEISEYLNCKGMELPKTESDLNKIPYCSNNATYLQYTNLKTTLPQYYTADGEFQIEKTSTYLDCNSMELTKTEGKNVCKLVDKANVENKLVTDCPETESHQTKRNKNPQTIPNRWNESTDQVFKSSQTSEIQKVSNLPPIVYQISMNKIKYAIQDGNKEKMYPDELAKVGITADGVWYFGNACESQPYCQTLDVFKLCDYLRDVHMKKYVYIGNHKHLLSLELLLSFVLASLKRKVEEEFRGQIRECIIIIPFWLPSDKRQQFLDAGKVAGFSDVCLINENSAIAAYFAKLETTEIHKPDTIFIMSENSAWVDVTAYTIEDGDTIKMIAHCGSYEVDFQVKCIIDLNHVEDVCSKVDSQISSWIEEVLSYSVPGGIKSKFYYASYDSINHKDILSKALKCWVGNGGYKYNIDGWNNGIAIKGALLCAQHQNYPRTYKLKEWICATVYYSNQSKAEHSSEIWEHFTKKASYLPFYSKPIYLPGKTNELSFFQRFPRSFRRHIIGLLKFNNLKQAQANNKIGIHFDHQAVPLFANECTSGNHKNVEWCQNNLDKQDIDEYKTLLKNIFDIPMQQKDELNKRNHLATMFSTLKKRILAGHGYFKSDTIKNMTIDQINDSLKTLADSADTATFANQQDIYTKLNGKYF